MEDPPMTEVVDDMPLAAFLPQGVRAHMQPDDDTMALHSLTHDLFQPRCEVCVAAKGREGPRS
eukprot:1494547-Lingulodinium_polyedra.AAC.1